MPSLQQLLILGTGFGAFNLIKHLRSGYDVTVVSPRNHFLFTPLLPSTAVGTIEFRSIIEPIRDANKGIRFFHASAESVDVATRIVHCKGATNQRAFDVPYGILVIAVGAMPNDYGIPGVAGHALFLKELRDASILRQRIIKNFEQASLPGVPVAERQRLLHFVVCGGGPTGVEFAAELNDFLLDDLQELYPHLSADVGISIVEAGNEILGTFDEKLRRYATEIFRRQRIRILAKSPVTRVDERSLTLADDSIIHYGLLLWAAGNAPVSFVKNIPLEKDKQGRIVVDSFFRAKSNNSIYAIGDCSVVENAPLPATAQVAQQQGKYLGKCLNAHARGGNVEPFAYTHLGMLAYIGNNRALADLNTYKGKGWTTWLFWRSAYLSRIVSFRNKFSVLTDWIRARIFGRDTSQF